MGRSGAWLGCHLAPVEPDLAVLSKGLTGGVMPLAATLASRQVQTAFAGEWDAGRSFLHSNTYSGHALAVAVAHAALDELATLMPDLSARGAGLRRRLTELAMRTGRLDRIRGVGMVAAADLVRSDGSSHPAAERAAFRVCRAALDHGAFLRPLGDTLYLLPPLNASEAILDELVAGLGAAITAAG
jgi:adenosylmethionine-8-amino-7-oxononanoate aminotransferase